MSIHKKKGKIVEELLAERAADPVYRAMFEKREAEAAAFQQEMRQAEAPLIENLRAVNIKVETVWDLVNTHASYPAAIPILLDHLQRDYPPPVREGIARALAVPEASWAWDVLFELFEHEPAKGTQDVKWPRNVKWALACALSGAATEEVIDRIIELVSDKAVGENRLALLSALARSSLARARATLENLREDPELSREIRVLIGRPKKRKR